MCSLDYGRLLATVVYSCMRNGQQYRRSRVIVDLMQDRLGEMFVILFSYFRSEVGAVRLSYCCRLDSSS